MATREQFVAEVRSWLGTPYRHQGRTKGVGVDCGGIVVMTCLALGLELEDIHGYTMYPRDGQLERECTRQMDRILPHEAVGGDVLLFEWDGRPMHMGVLTGPGTIAHAYIKNRRAVEHLMGDDLLFAIWGAFRIRGLET